LRARFDNCVGGRHPADADRQHVWDELKGMPEYDWAWGYPYALAMIALSAVLPLVWFKWRGWI
jgi:hypothetical protein